MNEMPSPDDPLETPKAATKAATIARLFREHNETLVRFLALKLRSQQAAQEVAQEAYVRVLSLDQPGAVSFLRAFLFKTASNLAVDRIRHEQLARQPERRERVLETIAGTPSPEQAAADAQELGLAEQLINELPPKCQRAFFLHKVCGLDFSEVAAQMGIKERMVRRYVVRAMVYAQAGLEAARAGGKMSGDRHG